MRAFSLFVATPRYVTCVFTEYVGAGVGAAVTVGVGAAGTVGVGAAVTVGAGAGAAVTRGVCRANNVPAACTLALGVLDVVGAGVDAGAGVVGAGVVGAGVGAGAGVGGAGVGGAGGGRLGITFSRLGISAPPAAILSLLSSFSLAPSSCGVRACTTRRLFTVFQVYWRRLCTPRRRWDSECTCLAVMRRIPSIL